MGHHATQQQLIWGLASPSQQDGALRGQPKILRKGCNFVKGLNFSLRWRQSSGKCRSHTLSFASPCFQCEMSRTTSANVNRNTDSWDIKRRYTFLTSCHVHRESRSIQDKGEKILRSHVHFLFPISQPWTHRLSTGGFAILPIKQKLCSEQHLCILGAIMHISNKKREENLTFFKMSILASPDVSSNAHLLFLYIYRQCLRGSRIPF